MFFWTDEANAIFGIRRGMIRLWIGNWEEDKWDLNSICRRNTKYILGVLYVRLSRFMLLLAYCNLRGQKTVPEKLLSMEERLLYRTLSRDMYGRAHPSH